MKFDFMEIAGMNQPLSLIIELEKLRRERREHGHTIEFQCASRNLNERLYEREISFQDKTPNVCYNQNGILAISKRVGLTSDEAKNLVQKMHPTWANIHRIDKLVSGCLIGGLSKQVRSKLHECLKKKRCLKVYCALIEHNVDFPKKITIDYPLKCGRYHKELKPCSTFVKTIWRNELIRVVLCFPITGRSKQIRRHLAREESQIVSIDLAMPKEKQVFLYLHSLVYQFDLDPPVTIQTERPHWVSHIRDFDSKVENFLQDAFEIRKSHQSDMMS